MRKFLNFSRKSFSLSNHKNKSQDEITFFFIRAKNEKILFSYFVFLIVAFFPLCTQTFFYQGSSYEYRAIVTTFMFIVLIFALIIFEPIGFLIDARFKNLIIFWITWGWLAVALSSTQINSFVRQMEWTILSLLVGVLINVFRKNFFLLCWFYVMLLLGFMFVGFGLVTYWFSLQDPFNYDWVRMTPGFSNIRHFGHYAGAIVVLTSIWPVFSFDFSNILRSLCNKAFFFCVHILSFSFLFWSGGRGTILSTFIGFFWIFFCLKGSIKKIIFSTTVLVSCLFGLFISLYFPVKSLSLGLIDSVNRTLSASTLDRLTSGRLTLWESSLESIFSSYKIMIFGAGPDSFSYFYGNTSLAHPHNIFIQVIYEWGFPGALVFFIIIYLVILEIFKQRRFISSKPLEFKSSLVLGAQSLFITFFFLSLVDGVFYYSLPLTILGVCTAIILSFDEHVGEVPKTKY